VLKRQTYYARIICLSNFAKTQMIMDFFNELIQGYRKANAYGRLNGMELKEANEGLCVYEMTITKDHLATPTTAHGGCISALMDGVLGVTALTISSKNMNLVSTVEFKINYLHPALLGDKLIGKGKVIRAGKRLIITQGDIFNQKGDLIATANGTFNSYPFEKSGMDIK
jgi:uncharacterized protein (TIGR00369 family)